MAIIGISGRIGSGKDTVGRIIQYLSWQRRMCNSIGNETSYEDWCNTIHYETSIWEIKKFADKLKDIVCLLINCTRKQLEDREFKEKELGEEWWYYGMGNNNNTYTIMIPYLDNGYEKGKEPLEYLIKLTPRLLLQLLGTECGRNIIHPNIWVNALMSEYNPKVTYQMEMLDLGASDLQREKIGEPIHDEYPNWIITDMRFPNELKVVKDRSGISIRVNRPWVDKNKEHQVITEHPSETALDNAEFDYIIDNNGTIEELIQKVREILILEKIV